MPRSWAQWGILLMIRKHLRKLLGHCSFEVLVEGRLVRCRCTGSSSSTAGVDIYVMHISPIGGHSIADILLRLHSVVTEDMVDVTMLVRQLELRASLGRAASGRRHT